MPVATVAPATMATTKTVTAAEAPMPVTGQGGHSVRARG